MFTCQVSDIIFDKGIKDDKTGVVKLYNVLTLTPFRVLDNDSKIATGDKAKFKYVAQDSELWKKLLDSKVSLGDYVTVEISREAKIIDINKFKEKNNELGEI